MRYSHSPFHLANHQLYQQWRNKKQAHYPTQFEHIHVHIKNPLQLSHTEIQQLEAVYQKTNFVIYTSQLSKNNDQIPLALAQQLGLHDLDLNWLGENNGLTRLSVSENSTKKRYIPYSNHPIKWHTDGYYNATEQQIHGMLLHCETNAAQGGINGLMDYEILYIQLRDKNPDYITALMQPDAFSIPPRLNDQGEVERKQYQGAVFSLTPDGELHMRYSQRTRNIIWKDDPLLTQARQVMDQLLANSTPYAFHYQLKSNMGVISNNILHNRSGFRDTNHHERLLYRGRYFNRLTHSGIHFLPDE